MVPTFLSLGPAKSTVKFTVKVFMHNEKNLLQMKTFFKEESVLDYIEDLLVHHPLYDFSVYKTEQLSVIAEDKEGNEVKF